MKFGTSTSRLRDVVLAHGVRQEAGSYLSAPELVIASLPLHGYTQLGRGKTKVMPSARKDCLVPGYDPAVIRRGTRSLLRDAWHGNHVHEGEDRERAEVCQCVGEDRQPKTPRSQV